MSDRDILIRLIASVEHLEKSSAAMYASMTKELASMRELLEQKNEATKDIAVRAHRRIDEHEKIFGKHDARLDELDARTGQAAITAWKWAGAAAGGSIITVIIGALARWLGEQ